jgi:hypothetical protein
LLAAAGRPPDPAELIYLPSPSWSPAFTALGTSLLAVGVFTGLFYSVVGAVLVLASLWRWLRANRDDIARMPREQRVRPAVLPPK